MFYWIHMHTHGEMVTLHLWKISLDAHLAPETCHMGDLFIL